MPVARRIDRERFQLTESFISGYHDKLQEDEVPVGAAVAGSKNFVVDIDGKWMTRLGTKYLGTPEKVSTNGYATSSGVLRRRDGISIPIVAHKTFTKILHPSSLDWMRFDTSLTENARFGFDGFDRSSDNINKLVYCNAEDAYRIWTGATAVVTTGGGTTTVSGDVDVDDLGFESSGSLIGSDGQILTYSGIFGKTFTGVSGTFPAGTYIAQAPTTYASNPKGRILLTTRDARILLSEIPQTLSSGAVVASWLYGGSVVIGSANGNPTDFTFSATRAAGEGFDVSVPMGGSKVTGIAQFEDNYLIFKNFMIAKLVINDDDSYGVFPLTPYGNSGQADNGSVSPQSVVYLGKALMFVSPTRVISTVQQEQDYSISIPVPISDAIRSYLFYDTAPDEETCAGAYQGKAYFAMKKTDSNKNDVVLVRNGIYDCWDTPFEGLSISSFFIHDQKLYATSHYTPDVFQIDTGLADFASATESGLHINAKLVFGRQSLGDRASLKGFQDFYVEGEMLSSGSVTFSIQFDETGTKKIGVLKGTDEGFFFESAVSGFGVDEFGVETFGGSILTQRRDIGAKRFRMVLRTTFENFFNYQLTIETSSYFKLFAFGPAAKISPFKLPASMKKALL